MRIRHFLHSFTILVPRLYLGVHIIFLFIFFTMAHSDDFDAHNISDQYEQYALAPADLRSMKHEFVLSQLKAISDLNTRIQLTQVGASVEGRSINMLSFGSGDIKLLLWSQMHGDEPTATASLLALFNLLARNADHPLIKNLYENLSINAIVMLNPDFDYAMQNWGVSTVLIESALHDNEEPDFLVKMNFVALLGSFDAIASGKLDGISAADYDEIPIEGRSLFDLMIRNVLIYNGDNIPPFKGDIGINISQKVIKDSVVDRGKISDIGDLSIITAGRKEIDGEGLAIMPGLIALDDSLNLEDLYSRGITFVSSTSDSSVFEPLIPPEVFLLNPMLIKQYTFDRSKFLKQNTGLIKRDKKADIILFSLDESGEFNSENIKFVINNGTIVYIKD